MEFVLTREEFDLLNNTIQEEGGFQSLQNKLLSQTDIKITLDNTDIEKICKYIANYGTGGSQTQFLKIFKNHLSCP